MTKYYAFLRAVNVGKRQVKMEALREHFKIHQFANVKTYIQTGNIIFETEQTDRKLLIAQIERELLKWLSFEVPTILRTKEELAEIIENDPFKDQKGPANLKQYVTFLSEAPSDAIKNLLAPYQNEYEQYSILKHDFYSLIDKDCEKNGMKLQFTNNFIEKKLKLIGTTRDWNTVIKIAKV